MISKNESSVDTVKLGFIIRSSWSIRLKALLRFQATFCDLSKALDAVRVLSRVLVASTTKLIFFKVLDKNTIFFRVDNEMTISVFIFLKNSWFMGEIPT